MRMTEKVFGAGLAHDVQCVGTVDDVVLLVSPIVSVDIKFNGIQNILQLMGCAAQPESIEVVRLVRQLPRDVRSLLAHVFSMLAGAAANFEYAIARF